LKNKRTYLVITPFFPSKNKSAGIYIYDQLNELRKKTNFDFIIIKVNSFFTKENDYNYNGFTVKIFKIIDFPFFIFPGFFNKINISRFNSFIKKKNIVNIYIVHSHVTYPSSYLCSEINSKKIIHHHGLDVLQLKNGRVNILRKIYRRFLIKKSISIVNNADLNIGVSNLVLRKLKEIRGYNPKLEYIMYNGVDKNKFYKKELVLKDHFTIGCIANFWDIKDQITLLKACHILLSQEKKIKLRLIGEGPTLSFCQDYIVKHSLESHVIYEGIYLHENLNNFYNQIDLFVLPSYYEALGCVYLESWATNTPFIAVKNQGISELIPNQFHDLMLVSKSNQLELSEKINYFIENKFIFDWDQNYDIRNTVSDFIKFLRLNE
tara:strand:+ start:60913 stop:62046 length:1134 start_codon:yes stop_codon:yes gene_type:complete